MKMVTYVVILFVVLAAGCISNDVQTNISTSSPQTTSLESSFYIYQFNVTGIVSKMSSNTTLYHSFHVSVSANYIEIARWLDYAVVENTTYPSTERSTTIGRLTDVAVVIVSNRLLWFDPSEVNAGTYTIDNYSIMYASVYTFYVHSDGYSGSIIVTNNCS